MRQALDAPDKAVPALRDHRVSAEGAADPSATESAERIVKDPLSRHKLSSTSVDPVISDEKSATMEHVAGHKSTVTISNSHAPSESIKPKLGASFQVFCDENSTGPPVVPDANKGTSNSVPALKATVQSSKLGSTVMSTLPTKATKPFSIFQDTENTSSTSVSKTLSVSARVSPAPFQIFSEPSETTKSSHSQHPTSSMKPKAPPAQAPTKTASPAEKFDTTADTADENQIQDLLNELGILDNEDGTINTRLARRDIDSLFASDSPDNSFLHQQVSEPLQAANDHMSHSSPKPLPIRSFAGGAFPSKNDVKASAIGLFGGNDLSIIEEVNCFSLVLIDINITLFFYAICIC